MEAFIDVEVVGIVDGCFGAKRPLLFEILFYMGVLVLDMQTGGHAIGDHAGPIAIRRRGCGTRKPERKKQPNAVGTSKVEVLPDDGLKEVTTLHGAIEDLGEADFDLADSQAVVVTSCSILRRHRPGEEVGPAIEEGLHVVAPKSVTGGLKFRWIGATEKSVVQTLELNVGPRQVLLDPLMTIEAELYRVGEVGSDLKKCRSPFAILNVKVEMFDGDGLSGEIESRAFAGSATLLGFEGSHLFLGNAYDNHAFTLRKAVAVSGNDVVLSLAGLKMHKGDLVFGDESFHGRNKTMAHRLK